MNLKKLVRDCKELVVTKVTDDTYGYVICVPLWMRYIRPSIRIIGKVGIDRRLELGLSRNISLNAAKELQDPRSSFKRLSITESILEEL